MAGMKVARGVLRAWRRAGRSMTTDVPLDSRLGYVAFDGTTADGEPVGPNAVLGPGRGRRDDGTCAPFDGFAGPGQGMKMLALGGPGDTLVPGTQPVSVMRIGPLAILACPARSRSRWGCGSARP